MFDELRNLYDQVIIQHGKSPWHQRTLAEADATARGDNPMCGDRIELQLKYAPDGTIADAAFDARGCAVSIASADLMVEAVKGHSPADARALFARFRDMARTGVCPECDEALLPLRPFSSVHEYPSRVKCATLPWHALEAALAGSQESTSE